MALVISLHSCHSFTRVPVVDLLFLFFFWHLTCILFPFYVTNTGLSGLFFFSSAAYLSTLAYIVIFIPCTSLGRLERDGFELWHNSHNHQFFRDDWSCRKSVILFLVGRRGSISLQSWRVRWLRLQIPQLTFWRHLMIFSYSFPFFVFLFVFACGLLRFPSPYLLLLTWHWSIEPSTLLRPQNKNGEIAKRSEIRLKLIMAKNHGQVKEKLQVTRPTK